MLLSRHWLNKYVDLKGIRNQQITEALNNLGFEVEQTTDFKNLNDPLVIGHIEESQVLPESHLTKNKVRVGTEKYLSIICGAPNVKRNQYVIVAKPGQKIATGLTLGSRQIKGQISEGMICALNEIGINNNSLTEKEQKEIYDLGKKQGLNDLVGHNIHQLGLDDFVWDVDLTLNRSDALSAFQIAKELARYFQVPLRWPLVPSSISLLKPKTEVIIDRNLKSKVISLVGKSLEVRRSQIPLTIYHNLLLKKVGIRTTGNFHEDLANLNAWETGQPLILIDRNKLLGNLTLQITTINDKELMVLMSNNELVQIIGQPTESNFAVDENTKTILVVALKVDEALMRRQSRHFEPNPAFQRYVKPISIAAQEMGLKNYERLLANYRLLRAKSPIKHWVKNAPDQYQVVTSLERINHFLGTHLTHKELAKIFRNSDFAVKVKSDQLVFTINPLRTDVRTENDIMEEVARLYGYNNIPSTPLNLTLHPHRNKWSLNMEQRVQSYLNALGFFNIKTYSLISEKEAKSWNPFRYEDLVAVLTPLSSAHTHYRRSLIPSFLKTASTNSAMGHKDFKLWEIADVYVNPTKRHRHLIFGLGGNIIHDPLNHHRQETNYYYVKGLVEAIVRFYGIQGGHLSFEALKDDNQVHPHASATIKYRHKVLGHIIRPETQLLNKLKLPITYLVELDLDSLAKIGARSANTYRPPNKFQVSKRALSFVLPNHLVFSDMLKQLLSHVHHLTGWMLIDYYQDKTMAANQEGSMTIAFAFNHPEHQLTEAEINHQWSKILTNAQKLKLKVR